MLKFIFSTCLVYFIIRNINNSEKIEISQIANNTDNITDTKELDNEHIPETTPRDSNYHIESHNYNHSLHIFKNEKILADDHKSKIKNVSSLVDQGESKRIGAVNEFFKNINNTWKENAFELFKPKLSDYLNDRAIFYDRRPDFRHLKCLDELYRIDLPETSVIIAFHNEKWSYLVRTIFSILEQPPLDLIREIILVDDASSASHLGKLLDNYIDRNLPKVKLLRIKTRQGLLGARLLGASVAKGDVLTFMDSHCECTKGWLKPLLDRIADNRNIVVTPSIDVIKVDSLEYIKNGDHVWMFDWDLKLKLDQVHVETSSPFKSPIISAGVFLIDRQYFNYLGSFDEKMSNVASGNLELSFRLWMCGGEVEVIPCSRVGRIEIENNYDGPTLIRDNTRVAEVWMDKFKYNYYNRIDIKSVNYGDITKRKHLRERLNCKDFSWYLNKVSKLASGLNVDVYKGGIRSTDTNMCLDAAYTGVSGIKVGLYICHGLGGNQLWIMNNKGEIRLHLLCLDYANEFLMIYNCHGMGGNQHWTYLKNMGIKHTRSSLCIERTEGKAVQMNVCNNNKNQHWMFQNKWK